MSQVWTIPDINPSTTSPLTDITRITDGFETLRTVFSGASEPTETVAYMMWLDSSVNILKRRNADNDAWLFMLSFTEDFVQTITTSYTTQEADAGTMILADASASDIAVTLSAAATHTAGAILSFKKIDSSTNGVVITPNASETIDDRDEYVLQAEQATLIIRSDGDNWSIVSQYLPDYVFEKTASFTAAQEDDKIIFSCDATDGEITLSLPSVADVEIGTLYTVKKTDDSGNDVVIDPDGLETIDSTNITVTLSRQNMSLVIVNDGTQWLIISASEEEGVFATAEETQSATTETAAVTPALIRYSPSAVSCWVSFTGNGGVNSSYGCSVARTGVGLYTISFDNAFSGVAAYSISVTCFSASPAIGTTYVDIGSITTQGSGSCSIAVYRLMYTSSGGVAVRTLALVDSVVVNVIITGTELIV